MVAGLAPALGAVAIDHAAQRAAGGEAYGAAQAAAAVGIGHLQVLLADSPATAVRQTEPKNIQASVKPG